MWRSVRQAQLLSSRSVNQVRRAWARELWSAFVSDHEGFSDVVGLDDLLLEPFEKITPQDSELRWLRSRQLVAYAKIRRGAERNVSLLV